MPGDDRSGMTVDCFDHNSTDFARHRFEWYRDIRQEHGPVFWSPHYGGFWVVIGLQELSDAAQDWHTFSSKVGVEEDGIRYDGLFAPPIHSSARLLQDDPPDWTVPRRALAAMFAPPVVAAWRDRIQDLVDACIDRRIESGRIDLVTDLSRPVSAVLSLELAGLPTDDHTEVAEALSVASNMGPDDPRWAQLAASMEKEAVRIEAAIDRHETARGPGAITALLNARDGGANLSREHIHDLASLVLAAGLDTTAALIGSTFVALAERPHARQALVGQPDLYGTAIEEFVRYGTPTQGLLRTSTRDVSLGGRQIRRGERVMLCYGAADRDPREFADPDEIVVDRPPGRSVAFGSGIHKCLGIHFARLEFEIVLRAVLARMPDLRVDRDGVVGNSCVGIVAGWVAIPATFTPGPRLGADPGVPNWSF